MALRSYGFLGSVRLQTACHEVLDSKEERDKHDLHLSAPFAGLQEYLEGFQLEGMDSLEHSHVPYPVILYLALTQWRKERNTLHPSSFQEKEAFAAMIKAIARDWHKEENFQQALREAYRVMPTGYSQELTALFQEELPESKFGVLVATLKAFIAAFGQLPASAALPDMISTTSSFIALQAVFAAKAAEDRQAFTALLQDQLKSIEGGAGISITPEEVASFLTHCRGLALVRTRSVAEELSVEGTARLCELILEDADGAFTDASSAPSVWQLALRAVDAFWASHARYPGTAGSAWEKDGEVLYETMRQMGGATLDHLFAANGAPQDMDEGTPGPMIRPGHALELARYGAAETHSISAIIGGVAAQEAVKLLTRQYLPLVSTYVFNGIATVGATYDL